MWNLQISSSLRGIGRVVELATVAYSWENFKRIDEGKETDHINGQEGEGQGEAGHFPQFVYQKHSSSLFGLQKTTRTPGRRPQSTKGTKKNGIIYWKEDL